VVKEDGWIYFLDKKCDVCRVKIEDPSTPRELVAETSVFKEPNFLYFLDEEGDISRINMIRYEKSKKRTN
jgi:hypothetical protein